MLKRRYFLACVIGIAVLVYTNVKRDSSRLEESSVESNSVIQKRRNDDKSVVSHVKAHDARTNMELYLRMTTVNPLLVKLYERVLVQSMQYFWPDNFSMVVVLDEEKPEDHAFGDAIKDTFPYPRICYMDPLTVPGYTGKDRMQRDMLYPERCTSKKYVAFIDTDTMFITRIIPEMLFVEGKPIIVAIYGNEKRRIYNEIAKSTAKAFKSKEVMRCMSYFPVIFKVEHILEMRQYLEKLHNMSVDEILIKTKVSFFCQYHLMCQYAWMFHRDEYHFRFQQYVEAERRPLAREDSMYYDKMLTSEQRSPIVRSSAHYKYVRGDWKTQETYTDLFRYSICFSGGFELCPEKCREVNQTSVWQELFTFEGVDWTWDSRCLTAQEYHFNEIAKYDNSDYLDIIRKACYEVDTLTWSI